MPAPPSSSSRGGHAAAPAVLALGGLGSGVRGASLARSLTGDSDFWCAGATPRAAGGTAATTAQPRLAVFSGGTAMNSVAGRLRRLTTAVSYILPVSDDGGSTAEIVRVLGGPAVGDIRSRCLRLADDGDAEAVAVRRLLAHRLPPHCGRAAKAEWAEIVEGDHPLWGGVSEPYKHTIRAFLVHFHTEVLRHSSERFSFRHGSVGNFFFAGARLFFRSLEAAIFVFSRVARIPDGSDVLPAVCTEERLVLAALLADGLDSAGLDDVPRASAAATTSTATTSTASPAPPPGGELSPPANPRALAALARADAVVYGMGSLYTSVLPALVLEGVGEAVAGCGGPKILLLNGSIDRETGAALEEGGGGGGAPSRPRPMAALDVAAAVARALGRARPHDAAAATAVTPADLAPFVTAVLFPVGTEVVVDEAALAAAGVTRVTAVPSRPAPGGRGGVVYDPDALVDAIAAEVAAHAGVV